MTRSGPENILTAGTELLGMLFRRPVGYLFRRRAVQRSGSADMGAIHARAFRSGAGDLHLFGT